MFSFPKPPLQLSKKALSELKIVLEKAIGQKALQELTAAEINRLGCYLLTLTATQLRIRMQENTPSMDK